MNTKPTKRTALAAIALALLATAGAALGGGLDNNPRNAGETQSRGAAGLTLDGAAGNPALVGLDNPPRGGLLLLPLSVSVWSDKLAPPLDLNAFTNTSAYVTKLMRESFGLQGITDPGKVSEKLKSELRDGIGVYTRVKASPFVFATRGFGLSVSTFADADARIPGGLLIPFFSDTEGLLAGKNGIDLSDMRVNAISASEIAVKLGFSTAAIPFLRDRLGFDQSAAGVGIKLLLGHAYFDAEMADGSAIFYDSTTNKYKAGARLDVLNAGTGFDDGFRYAGDYLINNPINGQGWGLDLGTVLRGNNHSVSIDVQDIGMILWSGKAVRKGSVALKPKAEYADGFDLNDLYRGMNGLFELDSLEPTNENYILWLPAALNLGYAYSMDFRGRFGALLGYLTAGAGFRQQIVLGVGHDSYLPRLSVGATAGLFAGYLPVRCGLIYGGPEKLTSALGLGLDAKYVSADVFYKAVGSPALTPKRGFEVGGGLTLHWGFRRAKAKPEEVPEIAEPEAVPFDAAPEPVMPYIPELFPADETVYEPSDITLVLPQPAPPEPEPKPEPKPEPEPEPLPQLTPEEAETLSASQRAINFMPGSAQLTEGSYAPLNAIANLLKQYPHIRYEVQGHTDSQGAEMHNLLLSAERAAVVKYYLISRGAPEPCLVAVGYGKNIPIADNNTVIGRALNRRVEFVQIESQEHYDWVKRFELEMIPRLTDRIIHWRAIMEPKNKE